MSAGILDRNSQFLNSTALPAFLCVKGLILDRLLDIEFFGFPSLLMGVAFSFG